MEHQRSLFICFCSFSLFCVFVSSFPLGQGQIQECRKLEIFISRSRANQWGVGETVRDWIVDSPFPLAWVEWSRWLAMEGYLNKDWGHTGLLSSLSAKEDKINPYSHLVHRTSVSGTRPISIPHRWGGEGKERKGKEYGGNLGVCVVWTLTFLPAPTSILGGYETCNSMQDDDRFDYVKS
jgi:hypothetical protein